MLPTKILKLRLARIAKGAVIFYQDKLMLVNYGESPDLNFCILFKTVFKVSLPKQWSFSMKQMKNFYIYHN